MVNRGYFNVSDIRASLIIQEVVAAKAHYNAKHAEVITNSTFADEARQLAEGNEVFLIESGIFDDLINA